MNEHGWLEKFERASWAGRVGLLGGGAVRVTATLIERAVDRAAQITADAEDAFRKELDPNVTDARIIEEVEERRARPGGGQTGPER